MVRKQPRCSDLLRSCFKLDPSFSTIFNDEPKMNTTKSTDRATRKIDTNVEIAATPERVFQALVAPSDICNWWGATTAIVFAQQGGFWSASWGQDPDRPDYLTGAVLTEFDPPHRIVLSKFQYQSKDGSLPFDAEMDTEFRIEPTPGGCRLTVVQDGFPISEMADEFYNGCVVGWRNTLDSLVKYLST